jgi:ribulose-bisphosphate carboxylase large chain
MEFKEEKIKSGNPRLDDLLYGGIPFGKQILIMGPPFIGKETMVNNFLLEGVFKGIPCLILTTDSSPSDIRDELKYIMPDIEQYEAKGLVKIAYPLDLFEPSNMPQLMSSIAGNIYGMKAIQNLRLLDFTFPERGVKMYKGPAFGINGIRKIMKVKTRPLVGTIIKPKVGLPSKEHARVAYESWVGGCDIVKDDENLTDQSFNPFRKRIKLTLEALSKAERETGEVKIYMPNVTAETDEMLERIDFVKDNGGRYVMLDVITIGFSGIQTAIEHARKQKLVVHAHRAMHAALTRNKKHGITMLALAKLYRLAGVDQLHVGTAVGKMEGPAQEV